MIILIIHIVVLSLIVGLYLNALRGPFVRITTTTTLTDSSGGLSGISPGSKINWVDPYTGIEKGAFVKAIEDNNTITTDAPFILHDEVAPWPPEGKQADIQHHLITDIKKKMVVISTGPVKFAARVYSPLEKFVFAKLQTETASAREREINKPDSMYVKGTSGRRLRRDELKIIKGGQK